MAMKNERNKKHTKMLRKRPQLRQHEEYGLQHDQEHYAVKHWHLHACQVLLEDLVINCLFVSPTGIQAVVPCYWILIWQDFVS